MSSHSSRFCPCTQYLPITSLSISNGTRKQGTQIKPPVESTTHREVRYDYFEFVPTKRTLRNTESVTMADSNTPKPSSSVKLVLLGEAAVGKVGYLQPP